MTHTAVPQIEGRDGGALGAAVDALWELTHVLRRECPWDQAQTAGTIVPHTIEEAWEVADAVRLVETAIAGGDEPPLDDLEDELGDLLFQVCFLAMWCGERNQDIDLASVARRVFAKLVRRHPHVFGPEIAGDGIEPVQATTADEVLVHWNRIKRDREQRGLFDAIPAAMPSLGRARKVQSRAASIGFDYSDVHAALANLEDEVRELRTALADAAAIGTMPHGSAGPPDRGVESEVGDVLHAAVNVARLARVDPDLALRHSTTVFQQRVEAGIEHAHAAGEQFDSLDVERQEHWYQHAKRGMRDA